MSILDWLRNAEFGVFRCLLRGKDKNMDIIGTLREIIEEIMDVGGEVIQEETYLIRDLGAESIDLLEMSVAINIRFNIDVKDDDIFLRQFRLFLTEAERLETNPVSYLQERFPFLSSVRINEICGDLEGGPSLKIKDLIAYIQFFLP
jgi:acyl carrier protein